jgi:HK97 family phage major capsid protein
MKQIRAFTGAGAEQRAERCGMWFNALVGQDRARAWCIDHGIGLTKAAGELTDSGGGFLSPVDFDAAIISVREAMGAWRQGAEVRPSRSDGQVRPRRVAGLTANFVSEGTAIPESSFSLDAIESTQRKMAVLGRASAELFEDSAADLAEFLASEIGYAFATKEDDCGFNGDGTSTYAGISGLANKLVGMKGAIAAASTHNTFLTLDATDLGNLVGGVMASALPGAAFYVSSAGYGQTFARIAAVGGGLVTTLNPDGAIASANYLGYPVRFSGKLPDGSSGLVGKAMLFFGNLKMSSVLVERHQQTIIAVSHDRALDTDQILIRGVQRLDLINHSVGDSATRGPVAMLVGTA